MKKLSTLLKALMLTLMLVGATAAKAEYNGPEIRYFYPGMGYEGWHETNENMKLYVYFTATAKVWEAKGLVKQNDKVVGTYVFDSTGGTSKAASTVICDYSKHGNQAVFDALEPGNYTIQVVEVTWEENGEKVTYNDGTPFGPVGQFNRPGRAASLVSETLFKGNTMKSYYPLGSDDGVLTFTFDKALDPASIHPSFAYGYGTTYSTSAPWSLSTDGTVLTIDLRGHLFNVADVLAPGVTFTDDSGNEIDPPSVISIEIEHMQCTDGARVFTTLVDPYTGNSRQYGGVFKTFDYVDITHATPVLTDARFYASSNPSETFASLTDGLDMMALYIRDLDVVATADVEFDVNGVKTVVPFSDITVAATSYNVPVPATITGNATIVVNLVNVVYKEEDGAQHTIYPINLSRLVKEVYSVEELLAFDIDKTVVFVIPTAGFKVTLANEMGYNFGEDNTAGVQIVTTTNEALFSEGTLLKGRLQGKMVSAGMFQPDVMNSQLTYATTDVSVGVLVPSTANLLSGEYDNRLITVVGPATVNGTNVSYGNVPVVTELVADYQPLANVTSVTGVLYNAPGMVAILPRTMDDFNQIEDDPAPQPAEPLHSLAEVCALPEGSEFVVDLKAAKVTFSSMQLGSVTEDGTAALALVNEDYEPIEAAGVGVNGQIKGMYLGTGFGAPIAMVYTDGTEYTTHEADIKQGEDLSINELRNPANNLRLVTLLNTEERPLITTSISNIQIAEDINVVDYFEAFDWDYEFPEKVDHVTGILFQMEGLNILEEGDGIIEYPMGKQIYICPRSSEDVVAQTSGVCIIAAEGPAADEIYNLNGVRVREAGQSLEGLTRGIYITKGRKVIVK